MRIYASLTFITLFAACAGGFDATDTCEQTAACLQKLGEIPGVSDADIDVCADELERVYDNASGTEQDRLDNAYEACEGKSSCDFFACLCDEGGADTPQCEDARMNR